MKKSDLKDGMFIKTRNGGIYVLYNGVLHRKNSFLELEEYQENLICIPCTIIDVREFDIVRVGKPMYPNLFYTFDNLDTITWIWERKEYQLNQAEYDLIKKLQDKYECVQFEITSDTDLENGVYICGYGKRQFGFLEIPLEYYNLEFEVDVQFKNLKLDKVYDIDEIPNNCEIKENE